MTIDDVTEVLDFDALPSAVRARLLDEVHECGAECARQAFEQGATEYTETMRGDVDAMRDCLHRYGCDDGPLNGYSHPDHPVWIAFWKGAASSRG